ncbi:MAG: serine protease [Sphaerochaeta sp.]
MFKQISQKYAGGCFFLLRQREDSVVFLGTAFLVHEQGYLLTATFLLEEDYEGLMVARPSNPEAFSPLSLDVVQAIPVEVVKADYDTNTALLHFTKPLIIDTPDHMVGNVESVQLGSSVLGIGFPFGHEDLQNLAVQSGVIASKVSLRDTVNLFLFDRAMHTGMAGGPLINYDDGRVIGIMMGLFVPKEDGGDFVRGSHPEYETSFSYAVSIEYGKAMLEAMDLVLR